VAHVVRTVPIVNNGTLEGPETVILSLQNPSVGATVGPLGTAVLTINDDEPRVQFASAAFNVGEGTPTATITVTRTGAKTPVVSVSYAPVMGPPSPAWTTRRPRGS
jgi:hypothetical protein